MRSSQSRCDSSFDDDGDGDCWRPRAYLGPSAPLVGKHPKTPDEDDGTQNHQISGQSGTVSEHDNMGAERILAAHWVGIGRLI
eukprot:1186989-Prorocentrum_minimum.AAC.1